MADPKTIYTVGGTVQAGGGLYIPRKADQELLELCRAGKLAFILSSRQVGKSSSMVRTAEELRKEGVRSVVIDLSALGVTVTQDEWYLGILNEIANSLELEADIFSWWSQHIELSPAKRLSNFFRDVMLREVDERVVIFFDEIDSTLSVDFSDDFFAALRAVYNARSTTPDFKRLSFVLIGVATPGDLISDSKRTPFNIGQRVELTDFSLEEAKPLAKGLGDREEALEWVFDWTSGHPFLTQRLCAHLAQSNGNITEPAVTEAVETLFIRDKDLQDNNLQFVRDMLLKRAADSPGVLRLYRNILHEKRVEDDEQSPNKSHLKLSGIVRRREMTLHPSNRIYRRVFNLKWVKENTPVSRWKYASVILAIIAILAIGMAGYSFYQQRNQASAAQAEAYVNSFNTSGSTEVRVSSLAGLIGLGGEYVDQSRELFNALSHEEQLSLFDLETPENVGDELYAVVENLYQEQRNNTEGNELLQAMAGTLEQTSVSGVTSLILEINAWLNGRKQYNQGQYETAIAFYTNAWEKSVERGKEHPEILFDRGIARVEQEEYEQALTDFNDALGLNPNFRLRVEGVIKRNQELKDFWDLHFADYPGISLPTSPPPPPPPPPPPLPPDFEDDIGVPMRLVPAGEFTMGSNSGENDEKPAHQVYLDAFYMDKYEVTNALYKACVDKGGCAPPKETKSNSRSSYYGNPEFSNYPVIYVDWFMAKTYCEWRGAQLPTEAQWEKVARGTDGRTFPWGEELDCSKANYCEGDTIEVGSYEDGVSPYGVHDMAGNVWEWVSSLHQPYPYSATDGREDLLASGSRALRGGSWDYLVNYLRSSLRGSNTPDLTGYNVGFRCARSP